MTKVCALYRQPTGTAVFDRYYFDRHAPLAKTLPGLRNYEVTRGPLPPWAVRNPCRLIATLSFDSRAAIDAALASSQGKTTAGDWANFATGGVDLLIAETEAV